MKVNEDRYCGCNNAEERNYDMETINMDCDCNMENENNDIRREMMNEIRSLDFAINELALYLDTHPEDQRALCLHRKYAKKNKELKDKYQRVYGPLTINYPCNKWRWLEEPWPWERGNY